MDKSDLYIKIVDCEEIQGKWEKKEGDWLYYNNTEINVQKFLIYTERANWNFYFDRDQKKYIVFLPDQSWYQKKLTRIYPETATINLQNKMSAFINLSDAWYGILNISFEQLWCMLYMKEVYNKQWANEGWSDESQKRI